MRGDAGPGAFRPDGVLVEHLAGRDRSGGHEAAEGPAPDLILALMHLLLRPERRLDLADSLHQLPQLGKVDRYRLIRPRLALVEDDVLFDDPGAESHRGEARVEVQRVIRM